MFIRENHNLPFDSLQIIISVEPALTSFFLLTCTSCSRVHLLLIWCTTTYMWHHCRNYNGAWFIEAISILTLHTSSLSCITYVTPLLIVKDFVHNDLRQEKIMKSENLSVKHAMMPWEVTDQTISAMTKLRVSGWFLLVSTQLFERFAYTGEMLSINATKTHLVCRVVVQMTRSFTENKKTTYYITLQMMFAKFC